MMKLGKYAFDSRTQAEEKIKALGVELNEEGLEVTTHKHAIIHLGFLVITNGVYDEEGNEITAPTRSDKYSVDTAWLNITEHPEGWADYYVEVSGNGAHSIRGINYQENKIK